MCINSASIADCSSFSESPIRILWIRLFWIVFSIAFEIGECPWPVWSYYNNPLYVTSCFRCVVHYQHLCTIFNRSRLPWKLDSRTFVDLLQSCRKILQWLELFRILRLVFCTFDHLCCYRSRAQWRRLFLLDSLFFFYSQRGKCLRIC